MLNEKNKILESLISLGLKENEAKVYLAILKMGQASVGQIADATDVQRTFIYDILEQLQDDGLVSSVEKKGVKHFSALSAQKLKKWQEEKLAQFESVLPELRALEKTVGDRPKVQFFEGVEGIKMALEDTLNQKEGSTILAYATGEGIYEQMPEFLENYFERRVKKNIKIKVLAPDNKVNREHTKHGGNYVFTGRDLSGHH
jgi:sugar-specific transcriptional regulator TrmB